MSALISILTYLVRESPPSISERQSRRRLDDSVLSICRPLALRLLPPFASPRMVGRPVQIDRMIAKQKYLRRPYERSLTCATNSTLRTMSFLVFAMLIAQMSFNPHPTSRLGATAVCEQSTSSSALFQPSPNPPAGCQVNMRATASCAYTGPTPTHPPSVDTKRKLT